MENQIVTETIDYDKLFSDKLNDKISVAKVIKERFKRRKDNLKKKAEEEMPWLAQVIRISCILWSTITINV